MPRSRPPRRRRRAPGQRLPTGCERVGLTSRRKELYEILHPETMQHVAGAHGANRAQGNASANLAAAFTAETADRTGRSERAVQRDAARGMGRTDDVQATAQGLEVAGSSVTPSRSFL